MSPFLQKKTERRILRGVLILALAAAVLGGLYPGAHIGGGADGAAGRNG